MNTPIAVERLREALDCEDIYWQEVRGYPTGTYLPDSMFTIWWQGPAELIYLWGHNFEFKDGTVEDVLTRLKSLLKESNA